MKKVRWQPLPTDEQVVAAIEERKEVFVETYQGHHDTPHDQWIFNHICTVLDHAKKVFELPEEELRNPAKKDMFKE